MAENQSIGALAMGVPTDVYSPRRQHRLDVGHLTAGGVGGAITNQFSYLVSTVPPGTADFQSGTNPDAAWPPNSVGRADDISMRFKKSTLPNSPVVFVLALSPTFGPEIPLAGSWPGSTGVQCLDVLAPMSAAFGITNNTGEAWHVTTIPANVRPFLAGVGISQQAFGIDIGTNTLHGSPCDAMVF